MAAATAANALDERLSDVSRRLLRELGSVRERLSEERARLASELDAERLQLSEELARRRQRLLAERRAVGFDRARLRVAEAAPDDEVLHLNVGGHLCSTLRSTLCLYEGSYLANMFSGRWEASIERDGAGRYFLDFDPTSFRLLLRTLRERRFEQGTGARPPPLDLPADREEHFQNLVEYLGLAEQLLPADGGASAASSAPKPGAAADGAAGTSLGSGLLQSAGALLGTLASSAATAASFAPGAGLPAAAPRAGSSSASAAPAAYRAPPPRPAPSGGSVTAWGPARALHTQAVAPSFRAGWSKKACHDLVQVSDADECVVSIKDSRLLACAAAVRATCGFEAGQHAWAIDVNTCSDWSYIGFVEEGWGAVSAPVGRSLGSWGVASNGAVYAGREEITRVQAFTSGSRVGFRVDMNERVADVIIDGQEFRRVFRGIPRPLFPAVSNCRSPARYALIVSMGSSG